MCECIYTHDIYPSTYVMMYVHVYVNMHPPRFTLNIAAAPPAEEKEMRAVQSP